VRKKGVLYANNTGKGADEEPAPFEHPASRGELKAAAAEQTPPATQLPWRERVEILTQHPKTKKIYGGVWDEDRSFAAPGGGIDPGETPEQAAVRELAEETGIQASNPVLLPIAPVDNPWSDSYRARTGRNFAGSRTHFVAADFVKKLRNKNLDVWSATNRRFYAPEKALAIMQGKKYMSPLVAEARIKAIQHLMAQNAQKTAAADILRGGEADNVPDSQFSSKALAEGAEHEHEHTNNNQVAKEIAKDHLSEDPRYYQKVEQIEKASESPVIQELLAAKRHSDNKRYGHKTQILRRLMQQSPQDWVIDDSAPKFPGITHTPTKFQFHTDRTAIPRGVKAANSVYLNAARNMVFNPRGPLAYDHTKPVFENIQNQLAEVKRRGDFVMQAQRNNQIYRSSIDPNYRYQLALQAFHGTMPQPALLDQAIETYGGVPVLGGRAQ
jgi:8-oxo-dGTP pyrophosphatase MutT (NUDIX family)